MLLTGNTKSFDVYIVEGDYVVTDKGEFMNAWAVYSRVYSDAYDYFENDPDAQANNETVVATYKEIAQNRVTYPCYRVIFAQAWYDSHGVEPNISSVPYRLLLPPSAVRFKEDGFVNVTFAGNARYTVADLNMTGYWAGSENAIWRDATTLPGNIISLQRMRDGNEKITYRLGVQAFRPITSELAEFAYWLKYNIEHNTDRRDGKDMFIP